MGLLDSLLKNKSLVKNVEQMAKNSNILGNLNLSQLTGNKNVLNALTALMANKNFTTKFANTKDENGLKDLLDTAMDALKDKKLSAEEKTELMDKIKSLVNLKKN